MFIYFRCMHSKRVLKDSHYRLLVSTHTQIADYVYPVAIWMDESRELILVPREFSKLMKAHMLRL